MNSEVWNASAQFGANFEKTLNVQKHKTKPDTCTASYVHHMYETRLCCPLVKGNSACQSVFLVYGSSFKSCRFFVFQRMFTAKHPTPSPAPHLRCFRVSPTWPQGLWWMTPWPSTTSQHCWWRRANLRCGWHQLQLNPPKRTLKKEYNLTLVFWEFFWRVIEMYFLEALKVSGIPLRF